MNSDKPTEHVLGAKFSKKQTLHLGKQNGKYILFWYDPLTEELTPEVEFHRDIKLKDASAVYTKYLKNLGQVN
jgi:hypothetical protein